MLDEALGGGLPEGSLVLVEGESGTGSTEFGFALLAASAAQGRTGALRFLSGLRSPARAAREAADVLGERPAKDIAFDAADDDLAEAALALADKLSRGDALVVESVSALRRAGAPLAPLLRKLGDAAERAGAVIVVLHAPGSVPTAEETEIREAADAVLAFTWKESGPCRRRLLGFPKLRGLMPVFTGEEVPIFEVALHRGRGVVVSQVKTVL